MPYSVLLTYIYTDFTTQILCAPWFLRRCIVIFWFDHMFFFSKLMCSNRSVQCHPYMVSHTLLSHRMSYSEIFFLIQKSTEQKYCSSLDLAHQFSGCGLVTGLHQCFLVGVLTGVNWHSGHRHAEHQPGWNSKSLQCLSRLLFTPSRSFGLPILCSFHFYITLTIQADTFTFKPTQNNTPQHNTAHTKHT